MKKIIHIAGLLIFIISHFSCREPEIEPIFEDQEKMTIYDYMIDNEEKYSSFLSILKAGGIDKTLSAYNPDGLGYTLFLPNNDAVNSFIEESDRYATLDDLLNDAAYVSALGRYHVVNLGIDANDFPFGALPEYTLSDDYLTVGFVVETDTAYYKINNQAPVIQPNIELSNGFIHVINRTLIPITFTTYDWLEQNQGYSIFREAVDLTGMKEKLDINLKAEAIDVRPSTLLIEHDSVFNKHQVFSLDDLISLISPDNQDYTDILNPLYNFVAYHVLVESIFLDDFMNIATNYTTYSEIPVLIDGRGLDIVINKGKEIFDTIIQTPDTTVINYIGFYYDESNVLTQSGVIHFIDRIMKQQRPTRAIQTYEFYNEPLFSEFREEIGEYIIEDSSALQVIKYSGADLFFVKDEESSPAWSDDYLYMNGDFSISYTIPKIVQGMYTVFLRADAFSQLNAVIEVYIDGKKLGGLIDLATGGSSSDPFDDKELGDINFLKYEEHTVEIQSLIPGRFVWDHIRFEPI
ncbi:MAG: fasciclin domain-containing protein [Bacteroidales bacterium]|nr:fasciclin domain-containing protein [Bacteroidales bacterium]